MPCYSPLKGYRSASVNPSGKRSIVFSPTEGYRDLPVEVPCGQCIGCRLEYSRQWAIRCMHEASLHAENCFITLTYSPEHLPRDNSLNVRHFQLFMKRLRKYVSSHYPGRTIRYFHCGEYGARYGRPHYHALLFGWDFPDRVFLRHTGAGSRLDRSRILETLWPFGYSSVGDVTFDSAAYVARYITKKVTGERAEEHYRWVDPETGEIFNRRPEYTTMSRRPGIAAEWYRRYKHEVYPRDEVIVKGRAMRPPKYYDSLFEVEFPEDAARVKAARKKAAAKYKANNTPDRLAVREKVKKAQISRLVRTLE